MTDDSDRANGRNGRRESTPSDQRLEMAGEAAWLYYRDGLDQEAVAERLGVSRVRVSRLLTTAREEGIVTFEIHLPGRHHRVLADELRSALGLEQVTVAERYGDEHPNTAVARSVATILDFRTRDALLIGIGWGRTLGRIPAFVRNRPAAPGVEVIDVVGRPAQAAVDDSFEASMPLGAVYSVTVRQVPAPALLERAELADALRSDAVVQDVLRRAARADLIVVGLGGSDARTTGVVESRSIGIKEIERIIARGAVGDVIGRYFDVNGDPVVSSIEQRLIGLTIEDLKRAPEVLVAAAGPEKVAAVIGAARAGFVGQLVTDVATAQAVLKQLSAPN